MEGIYPEAVDLCHDESSEGKGINEGGPEPDIYYHTEEVAPENAESHH